jgi:hypothetical protein
MTQWQLAQAADVPRGVIIDFEFNALPPKPAYLEAMRRVLEQAGAMINIVAALMALR